MVQTVLPHSHSERADKPFHRQTPELLHYSMLDNLIKRIYVKPGTDTAREAIRERLYEILHALYASSDWNFRYRTNWLKIWDAFREIELHWVSVSFTVLSFSKRFSKFTDDQASSFWVSMVSCCITLPLKGSFIVCTSR